jgi:hypothetical protein
MLKAGEALSGRAQYTVPLVLALEHAEKNRAELSQVHDAKVGFGEVMRALKDA